MARLRRSTAQIHRAYSLRGARCRRAWAGHPAGRVTIVAARPARAYGADLAGVALCLGTSPAAQWVR